MKREESRSQGVVPKEFQNIKQLPAKAIEQLDKLRSDLIASIERTQRIKARYIADLQKHRSGSNRIKHVIDKLEVIGFHSDAQVEVALKDISKILNFRPQVKRKSCDQGTDTVALEREICLTKRQKLQEEEAHWTRKSREVIRKGLTRTEVSKTVDGLVDQVINKFNF